MQIIYAAPFILLSLLCFGVFLAVPRFRRFALAALVAPVAFGFCAIVGYVAWVLVCDFLLKIQLRPVEGLHGVIEILLFFVTRGVWDRGRLRGLLGGRFASGSDLLRDHKQTDRI